MSRIADPFRMGKQSPFLFDDDASRYSTAPAVWTPTALGSALKAWWSADDHGTANMTDDGSGLISQWKDRTSGIALTGTTTARPTWASNSFNGSRAGVSGDGVANRLAATSFAAAPTGANESWVFLQCSFANLANSMNLLQYGGTVANSNRRMQKTTANGVAVTDGTTGVVATADNPTSPCIIAGNWLGTNARLRFNGAEDGAVSPATIPTLNTGTTRFAMFATNASTPATFANAVLRNCLVTSALTLAQQQQLEGWLAWDGGIVSVLPSDHPFKNWAP